MCIYAQRWQLPSVAAAHTTRRPMSLCLHCTAYIHQSTWQGHAMPHAWPALRPRVRVGHCCCYYYDPCIALHCPVPFDSIECCCANGDAAVCSGLYLLMNVVDRDDW